MLRGSDWLEHNEALRHARESKCAVEQAIEATRLTVRRLKRIEQALEPIATRKQLLLELVPLADVVLLPPEFPLDRREATSKAPVG